MSDEPDLNPCQMGECPSGDPHCEGCEPAVFAPLSIVVNGHEIFRDDEGVWTFTPAVSGWGFDDAAQMEKELGFRPEPMSLEDAGFAYAPEMGSIMQALCERIAKKGEDDAEEE